MRVRGGSVHLKCTHLIPGELNRHHHGILYGGAAHHLWRRQRTPCRPCGTASTRLWPCRRLFDSVMRATSAARGAKGGRREVHKNIISYIHIIHCGPKGGYRAYMGWEMWVKCAPGNLRSLEWRSNPPCHRTIQLYMLYSTLLGDGAPDVYPQRTKGQSGSPHHPTGMHVAQL